VFHELASLYSKCIEGERLVEFFLAGRIVPEVLMDDSYYITLRSNNFKTVPGGRRAKSEAMYGAGGLCEKPIPRFFVIRQVLLLCTSNRDGIVLLVGRVKQCDSCFSREPEEIQYQFSVCFNLFWLGRASGSRVRLRWRGSVLRRHCG